MITLILSNTFKIAFVHAIIMVIVSAVTKLDY